MGTFRKLDWKNLKHEYGVDGERLVPWNVGEKSPFPFEGAYCICRAKTDSFEHINSPSDEQEMFVVVSGKANVIINGEPTEMNQGDIVYIPAGDQHYISNPYDEDFHIYALWWNSEIVSEHVKSK